MSVGFNGAAASPFAWALKYSMHQYPQTVRLSYEERFEKLKLQYSNILNSGPFEEVATISPGIYGNVVIKEPLSAYQQIKLKNINQQLQDLETDDYLLIQVHGNQAIGMNTRTGFAVCAWGRNKGNTFLALAYKCSSGPEGTLRFLMDKLVAKGCSVESIEIYIVGGILEEETDCIDSEEEFLYLSNRYPIKGARFNCLSPIAEDVYSDPNAHVESLNIIFTDSKIYFSKEALYNKMEENTRYLALPLGE